MSTILRLRARRRYLDLLVNPASRERFANRSRIIEEVRTVLREQDFLEVETPILQAAASGAAAKPFQTHHNALGEDLYLRISPETYLKRLVAGGLDRVFELGRNFRNEGMDSSHLPEFTMVEWYAAYWDYTDNMTSGPGAVPARSGSRSSGPRSSSTAASRWTSPATGPCSTIGSWC